MKVAILVDGGFYKIRAKHFFGAKKPAERADELFRYCQMHLQDRSRPEVSDRAKTFPYRNDLYRIFYYDCPPSDKTIYHPFLKKNVAMLKTPDYKWQTEFLKELTKKRKIALRLGFLAGEEQGYILKQKSARDLFSAKKQLSDITADDFRNSLVQKCVDIKIGIDIATIAYKHLADQVVLISGDSDFVPVAKLARREGFDFILDPMGIKVREMLFEHIDGLQSYHDDL